VSAQEAGLSGLDETAEGADEVSPTANPVDAHTQT
jgi:hypothetical protein